MSKHLTFLLVSMIFSSAGCGIHPEPPRAPSTATPAIVGPQGQESVSNSREITDRIASEAPDPQRQKRMLSLLEHISDVPLYSNNRVELLIDGPSTYQHMLRAIKSAHDYILLETYIFSADDIGERFVDALMVQQARGVAVFVIYDSFGSSASGRKFFDAMESKGIAVVEHNEINPAQGGNPIEWNYRDHRKILVVDGEVGFVGGINVAGTYTSGSESGEIRDPTEDGWRDSHIEIRGPAVTGLQTIFRENWDHQDTELPTLNERVSAAGSGQVVALLQSRGEDDEVSSIYIAYQEAMRQAKHHIWVTQAYFAPDKAFINTLKDAAKRGVDVRLILPGVTDIDIILDASRSRYGGLLKSGVRIYEAQNAVLHAKTAVIDGVWSTVGSSNLDYRSFLHNDEVNAVILGRKFGRSMEAQFKKDLETSKEIKLQQWKKRPLWRRIKERFAWLVAYWL